MSSKNNSDDALNIKLERFNKERISPYQPIVVSKGNKYKLGNIISTQLINKNIKEHSNGSSA